MITADLLSDGIRIQELKNIFNYPYFIHNEYFSLYMKLIEKNLDTQSIKGKTQKHHVVPLVYFKISQGFKSRKQSETYYNSVYKKEGIVNLTYPDHILAHYYLCLFTKGQLKEELTIAFYLITKKDLKSFVPELDLNNTARIYEDYYKWLCRLHKGKPKSKEAVEKMKQTKLQNKDKYIHPMLGKHHSDETIRKIREAKKGKECKCKKAVICIETGQVYGSVTEASKENHFVSGALKNPKSVANGYHWSYVDDIKTRELLSQYQGKGKTNYYKEISSKHAKPIICIETQEKFESIAEAQRKLGYNILISNTNKLVMSHGYHYCFISDKESINKYSYLRGRDKTDITEIYKEIGKKKTGIKRGPSPKRKEILCVELQKEFQSLCEAMKWCKENNIKADIASHITGRQKSAGKLQDGTKLHWRYI